ncbi:hypothetical protein HRG_011281 [Hirsutella rhossiliensis]|uniref:Chromo domain-containing protein n=1 Tax=Hirsutella rhossiliensis TaxID=111463 RepID=A0A9P8MMC5_9HYPO|nr:uncharacterized protein HRG_11281 [Hirsutella rhossiliensis]KAH0957790.1 hypothetical protein HRG_11281 [Hirsutella rhossiliensis]
MDANRLQILFSEYERVISEQIEPQNGTLESLCPEPQHQALSEAIAICEQSGVTQPRRSQRKRNVTPRPATTALNRIQKKRIATCSSQEYEFLRLGEVRKAWNGSIEYKVIWKPTWVSIDDLRGKRALEEAEELIVDEFGQVSWEKEMGRSGHVDMDTESE